MNAPATQVGYNVKKEVVFMPVAALYGHNMKEAVSKDHCDWWNDGSMFDVSAVPRAGWCHVLGPGGAGRSQPGYVMGVLLSWWRGGAWGLEERLCSCGLHKVTHQLFGAPTKLSVQRSDPTAYSRPLLLPAWLGHPHLNVLWVL